MEHSTQQLADLVKSGTVALDSIPARELFLLQVYYYRQKDMSKVKDIGFIAHQRRQNPLPWEDTRNKTLPAIVTKKGSTLVFNKSRGVYVEQ